jgi:hypothetical protein
VEPHGGGTTRQIPNSAPIRRDHNFRHQISRLDQLAIAAPVPTADRRRSAQRYAQEKQQAAVASESRARLPFAEFRFWRRQRHHQLVAASAEIPLTPDSPGAPHHER